MRSLAGLQLFEPPALYFLSLFFSFFFFLPFLRCHPAMGHALSFGHTPCWVDGTDLRWERANPISGDLTVKNKSSVLDCPLPT